jgi:hypothetical protein
MKIFWLNDSLCLNIENDAERHALKLVQTALLQTPEVETKQAPGVCPGRNLRDITSVTHEAQLLCIALSRMQSFLSVYDLTQSRRSSAVDDILSTH